MWAISHPGRAYSLPVTGHTALSTIGETLLDFETIHLVEPGVHNRVRATLRQGAPIYWDAQMAKLSNRTTLRKESYETL